ncbi:MAG: AraC family transcriptional regulator [Saprospiraceae bacterium]|nr:AraC family transcriptional regulator [Saprospiraceae bacterium]
MNFATQSVPVPVDLQPYVHQLWFCVHQGSPDVWSAVNTCLPSGNCELILHLDDMQEEVRFGDDENAPWTLMPKHFFTGVYTEKVHWRVPGTARLMGLMLKPEGIHDLFGISVGELSNRYVEVSNILGPDMLDLIKKLEDSAPDQDVLAGIVFGFLRQRIKINEDKHSTYLTEAIRYIRRETGAQTVEQLCEKVFVGERQLQRAFLDKIGVGPKLYGRIIRFNSACYYLQNNPTANWTSATYAFGYTDQSHLIREFRQFTGLNPQAFLSRYRPQDGTPYAVAT